MSAATADGSLARAADSDSLAIEFDTDDDPPSATWVAAYAMGLVASDRQADGVKELLSCIGGSTGSAREALARLDDPAVGDRVLRCRARQLIELAVAHIESNGSHSRM